jgi:hypothetical protein
VLLLAIFTLLGGCGSDFEKYRQGQTVSVGGGVKFRVPDGREALLTRFAHDTTSGNPMVYISVPGAESTSTFIVIQVASNHPVKLTGPNPTATGLVQLESGWIASVTTWNENRPGRIPTLGIIARLSKGLESPLRLSAFYRESAADPNTPPNPRTLLDRVMKEIQLHLP